MTKNQQHIPNIQFESTNKKVEGIDIIRIEDLLIRKDNFDHNPEKPHQLNFNVLIYFIEGKTKHFVDFEWYNVEKDSILYLSKNQVNAFKFNKKVKGFIILFTDEYLKKQLNKLPKSEIIRLFNSQLFSSKIQISKASNVSNYIQLFFEEFYKEDQSFDKQTICNSLFTVIFTKLEALKQYQTLDIKDSKKLIDFLKFKNLVSNHFVESRNADFYAQKMNITYKHLNTICKDVINSTAKQFIDEFIILEAKRKLVNSIIKSTELSYSLGFEEPTNFVKYFKKLTGLTPNSFKNNYK